ncbi:hypothetical protein ACWDSD_34885 [Streptomyces spiralis]
MDLRTGQYATTFVSGGTVMARVPDGQYALTAYVDTAAADGTITSSAMINMPSLNVANDMTVTADARQARRATATLDSTTARQQGVDVAGVIQTVAGQVVESAIGSTDPAVGLYVTATLEVTDRPYSFAYRTIRAEPLPALPSADMSSTDLAPRAYHLALVNKSSVPAVPEFRVHDRDLAQLDTRYHADAVAMTGSRFTAPTLPGENFPLGGADYEVRLPGARRELYSASPGLRWMRDLQADRTAHEVDFLESGASPAMQPGQQAPYDWNLAALGVTVDSGPRSKCRTSTEGGGVLVMPYPFASSAANYDLDSQREQTLSFSRDGVPLGSYEGHGGCVPTPPGASSYTFHVTAERSAPWTNLGTRADVTWTAAYTPDPGEPWDGPPLINVRVHGDFDPHNSAPFAKPFPLEVTAAAETVLGPAADAPPVRTLTAEVSYDDGAHWSSAPVTEDGTGRWTVTPVHPEKDNGTGFVSLRLRADDGAGNAVDQTVIRAYGLR